MSPSLRGRGLKFIAVYEECTTQAVALFTRAWIEMLDIIDKDILDLVALFTRAWIEIP